MSGVPHVPPALLAVAAVAAQRRLGPGPTAGSRLAAVAPAAVSGWLLAGAVRTFRHRGTTLNPVRPGASVLVADGPNAFSRNPMYTGMAGLLLAHAVARRSVSALGPVAGFVLALDRLQVPAEEAVLRESFGSAYEAYVAVVPRWLDACSVRAARRLRQG